MKTISTLFAAACLISNVSFAQYTQDFEGTAPVTSGCALVVNADRTTVLGEVITGTGSLFSNPPTNGSGTRDYATPYLNIIDLNNAAALTTSLTVAFNYKLNQGLNGNAVRTIEVGLLDKNGVFTSLETISMNAANSPTASTLFNRTFSVATGVRRLALKMGGGQGNGNVRTILDNLVVSANAYYSSVAYTTCNAAPLAQNDTYTAVLGAPFTALIPVTANDSDPNGETLSVPVIATQSLDGTVVMNADGTFTFTPGAGFTGASTTFTYTVSDNGYDIATSTATVTINTIANSTLPIKLLSFSGSIVYKRANLNWSVAENETGDRFEIEKSADGRNFTSVSTLFTTDKIGTETYSFRDAAELTATAYYRLKIVNKDNSVSYSKIVTLKTDKDGAANSLTIVQNPVGSTLQFQYKANSAGVNSVIVYNTAGMKVMSAEVSLQQGSNAVSINMDNKISTGTYFVEVTNGSERSIAKMIKK